MTHLTPSAEQIERLVAVRRSLHANPQPGYQETFASRTVRDALSQWNVPHVADIAETGIVAWLLPEDQAAADRPALALRADMDALPMVERTGLEYASRNPGYMHACGHDGHTTILLGVVQQLATRRTQLPRPVKFLFQPAEEVGAGARRMVDAGALSTHIGAVEVGQVIGLHNWPQLPHGTVVANVGPMMAGTDRLTIRLRGRGGHAAMPHLTVDLNVAAAALIQTLQTVVSRSVCPTDAAVLSISRVAAGQAHNVLPASVELEGTVRYFTDAVRQTLYRRTDEIARGIALAYGCEAQVVFDEGYPPVINEAQVVRRVTDSARQLGLSVLDQQHPSTASEDFAFYGQHASAAFFFLGATPPSCPAIDLHCDTYDFNDQLLPTAIALLTAIATSRDTQP